MKYRVVRDNGFREGWRFDDKEFDTVDEAFKHANTLKGIMDFEIVTIIDQKTITIED